MHPQRKPSWCGGSAAKERQIIAQGFSHASVSFEMPLQGIVKALRPRRRPRIRPRGVMECGSVGVLRQVGIAPRDREFGDAEWAAEIR
jgi:hypothetical protein